MATPTIVAEAIEVLAVHGCLIPVDIERLVILPEKPPRKHVYTQYKQLLIYFVCTAVILSHCFGFLSSTFLEWKGECPPLQL